MFLGIVIYMLFFSKTIVKISVKIILFVKKIILGIIKVLIYPLKIIIEIIGKVFVKPTKFLSNYLLNIRNKCHNIKIKSKKHKNLENKEGF